MAWLQFWSKIRFQLAPENTMRRLQLLIGSAAFIAAQPGLQATAQLVSKYAEQLKNDEFNWFPARSPQGPVLTTHVAATPKHQAGSDFVVIDGIY
jgi:hypothetical protein